MFIQKIHHLIRPWFLLAFTLCLLSTGCATQTNQISQASPTQIPTVLESTQSTDSPAMGSYEQDAQKLIDYVEEIHPIFLLNEVPSDYEDEKQHYLEASKANPSPQEFKLLTKTDTNADQKTLYPDVLTKISEDALERAITYLNEK